MRPICIYSDMKKIILLLSLCAILFAACDPFYNEEEDEPTAKEQQMVTEEMTWTLDSMLVIYDYRQIGETRQMLYPSDGIDVWSFTFYPCTYKFPEDLSFTNEITGEVLNISKEYNKDFCKFICTSDGSTISAGYLCYYRDFFTFNGLMTDGWMVFMIREANTNWDTDVWTSAFNAVEYDNGIVAERHIEYYSRVQ